VLKGISDKITVLNLKNNGLALAGLSDLFAFLEQHKHIKKLLLSKNPFGSEGAALVATFLKSNTSLECVTLVRQLFNLAKVLAQAFICRVT